jgi:anti-sigma regulatory factor (Ser/Thr protein kinase)
MTTSRARFPYDPTSVSAARHYVESRLGGLPVEVRDRVKLMVSEVATNAVKHAGSGFDLTLKVTGTEVKVEIRDHGPGRPTRRDPPPTQPNGRGLMIVEAVSASWGIKQHRDGSTVWFITGVPAKASAR